jgi:glycerol uptake facilitator-like aquaporin
MTRKLAGEFLGSLVLLMAVAGSGMMAVELSSDTGIQLFINAFTTILALGLLIFIFAPISGAHFNPIVSLIEYLKKRLTFAELLGYLTTQASGAVIGVVLANLMFEHPALFPSHHLRNGWNIWLGEVVATGGLIFIIQLLGQQKNERFAPLVVASWIGSAYFFTSSTSFANPAVTLARSQTDTFSGIAPSSVPTFIAFQLIGALIGWMLSKSIHTASKGLT